jgi:hypothetical protein
MVWHERYIWHESRTYAGWMPPEALFEPLRSAEAPNTKRRLRNLLEATGMLDHLTPIRPRPSTGEELLRLHTEQ